jgi:hypothetical protein
MDREDEMAKPRRKKFKKVTLQDLLDMASTKGVDPAKCVILIRDENRDDNKSPFEFLVKPKFHKNIKAEDVIYIDSLHDVELGLSFDAYPCY